MLIPKRSRRGHELVIKASGVVTAKIEKGSYIRLQVKYGLIRLINQVVDLCDQITNVDLECPIEEGVLTITKSVELPREIPPVSTHTAQRCSPAAPDDSAVC